MRLLHVYSGNLYGGVERVLVTLASSGDASFRHEFALCYEGRLAEELQALGAAVHRLPPARLRWPLTIRRARQRLDALLATSAVDIVVCHAPWSLGMFGAVGHGRGIPIVLWQHGAATGHVIDRWAASIAPDLIISNSRYTAGTLGTRYANVPRRVLHYPVNRPSDTPIQSRQQIRGRLAVPQEAVLIAHVSRMEAWKGHMALLTAMSTLSALDNWRVVFVGGPQRPSERRYFDRIRQSASELGLPERVLWPGEQRDVQSILRAADIYCQPNTGPEPFGIALVEALWAGLPVITTALGGPVDIVDESCGIAVPPGDVTALADAIRRLCTNSALRQTLAAGGPGRAAALCDPTSRMRDLRVALESIFTPAVA
jgi:glycosyltransferase involved in cell wall biosynthesis